MNDRLIYVTELFYTEEDPDLITDINKVEEKARLVTAYPDEYWSKLYMTPGTMEFQEERKIDDHGFGVFQKFKGSAPGSTLKDQHSISELQFKKLYIRMDTANNESYVVGISGDPVMMNFTENKLSGEIIVEFSREDDCPALILY